jgi:flagellar L-ring protein precursor FlgH
MQLKLNQRIVFSLVGLIVICLVASNVQAASLWVKAGNVEQSMFADKVARNIGDILTVELDDDIETNAEATIKTAREYQDKAGIGIALNGFLNQFLQSAPALLGLAKGPKSVTETGATVPVGGAIGDINIPTVDFANATGWKSEGNILKDTIDLKGKTTVTVVDVLPNGNLVIEGAKVIRTSQQDVYGYMRGVVRPVDISATNIVLSSKVADAQVEFVPAGELSDAQKKGWLLRAWEKVRPL